VEAFFEALKAYQTYNPQGWVGLYRVLPMWAGILFCVLGLSLLLFGGGRAFRLVAGPVGALIGLRGRPCSPASWAWAAWIRACPRWWRPC
jgi:hypothetical protein